MEQCRSILPYNTTLFPGHYKTPEEAIARFMDFSQLMACHPDLELFLCAYLFPECGQASGPRYPCAELCHDVQAACRPAYAQASATPMAELNFFCERYESAPDDGSEAKLCRSSFEGIVPSSGNA